MSEKKNVEFDKEIPENVGATAKRLFGQLKNQRSRLIIVGICICFYVFLNIFTPYYSAGVIDKLLSTIRECVENGTKFKMEWETLGAPMLSICVMYALTGIFYHFQGYLMANVAENLILTLRKQISHKLNKLPLLLLVLLLQT